MASQSYLVRPATETSGVYARVRRLIGAWGALVLGLLAAIWGARGMFTGAFDDPDSARHAMNGVLIHDWLHSTQWLHPLRFARAFYSHLPAISIPYHPPLFPAAESLFYFAFGVHGWSARLAIACATFLAAALLYAIVRRSHGSAPFAVLAVAVTFLVPEFQQQASDVMLEMPSLVLVLAALWFLRPRGEPLDVRHAIAFGLLGGAAIWTKQQSIFLVGCPFAMLAFRRRWRDLRTPPIWVATGVLALAAGALTAFELAGHAESNATWGKFTIATPFENAAFYVRTLIGDLGLAPAVCIIAIGIAVIAKSIRGTEKSANEFYAAWALTALLLPMLLPFFDPRYLFNAYPPLIVLSCDAISRAVPLRLRWAAAAAAIVILAIAWHRGTESVRGPREAAEWIMARHPSRVIYLGAEDGAFIFAVRERDPGMNTFVIRGDKLDDICLDSDLASCARQLGVEFVAVESASQVPIDRSISEVRDIPMSSPSHSFTGRLAIYRIPRSPSVGPVTVKFHSNLVKGGIEATIDK